MEPNWLDDSKGRTMKIDTYRKLQQDTKLYSNVLGDTKGAEEFRCLMNRWKDLAEEYRNTLLQLKGELDGGCGVLNDCIHIIKKSGIE